MNVNARGRQSSRLLLTEAVKRPFKRMGINPMERNTGEPLSLRLTPRCGPKRRDGLPCRKPRATGRTRCRLHGAPGSSAPRGNNGRYSHGLLTAEAIEERIVLLELLERKVRRRQCIGSNPPFRAQISRTSRQPGDHGETLRACAKNAKMLGGSFAGICARLKTCKWLIGKPAPGQYGDKGKRTMHELDSSAVPHETTYRYSVVCQRTVAMDWSIGRQRALASACMPALTPRP